MFNPQTTPFQPANIDATTKMLMGLQEKGQLQQYVAQHKDDPNLVALALYVNNMSKARPAIQAENAQPKVVDQAIAQMAPPQQMLPEDQGIGMLPAQNMQRMAGGGIVAFADGGSPFDAMSLAKSMVRDDEDDSDLDYLGAMSPSNVIDRQFAPTATQYGAFGEAPLEHNPIELNAMRQVREVSAKEEGKPAKTVRQEVSKVERPAGLGDLQAMAIQRGKEYDLDPKLVTHVMAKETGGLKDKAAAVSPKGAMGVMQLMPATAKEMGVKDPFDPVQNIEGGIKYLAMMDRKYGDPKIAAIAYNWGPGNTDRWLASGADASKLPKETRNYIAGLAEGGSVKHYATGDSVQSDDTSFLDTLFPPLAGGKPNPLRELLRRKDYKPEAGTVFVPETGGTYTVERGPEAVPSAASYTDEAKRLAGTHPKQVKSRSQMQVESSPTTPQPAPLPQMTPEAETAHLANLYPEVTSGAEETAPAAAEEKPSTIDDLREYFTKGMQDIKDQREQNKWLALMSAGLGAMGGTSPYAMANIGAGGEKGISTYLAGQKDLAAQQNALMSGRLGLEKYQSLRDIQQAQLAANKDYRETMAQTRKESIAEKEKANLISNMTRMEAQANALADAEVKATLAQPMAQIQAQNDPNFESNLRMKALERHKQSLYQNPAYRYNFQKLYGDTPENYFAPPVAPPAAAGGQGQWGIKLKP